MFESMEEYLEEPWFTAVYTGIKRYIVGLASEHKQHPVGSVYTLYNDDLGFKRTVNIAVTSNETFPTFESLLKSKSVWEIYPTVVGYNNGIKLFRRRHRYLDEISRGVECVGIEVNHGFTGSP